MDAGAGRLQMREAMRDLLEGRSGAQERLLALAAAGARPDPVDEAFYVRLAMNELLIGREGAARRLQILGEAGARAEAADGEHFMLLATHDLQVGYPDALQCLSALQCVGVEPSPEARQALARAQTSANACIPQPAQDKLALARNFLGQVIASMTSSKAAPALRSVA